MFASVRAALRRLLRRPPAPTPPRVKREEIERLVGIPVNDLHLYEQALRHRSLLRGRLQSPLESNERLEFLGDAVLGFVTAEHLYHQFPSQAEGFLTRLRAKLVNGRALARAARRIGLGHLILMSHNMARSDGRENQSILADAFEAVIGALYLDLGIQAARAFIERTMLEPVNLRELAHREDNYKSLLLEYVQALGWAQPQYRVLEEAGPSHDRVFTVEVLLGSESYGYGTAGSKKKAEQQAAGEALARLRSEGPDDA